MIGQRQRDQIQNKYRQQQTIEAKTAIYSIDRSSMIYRDSQMGAIYVCRKTNKKTQQTSLACIKQSSNNVQIVSEWNNITAVQKLQLTPSYKVLFQGLVQANNGKKYIIMKQFRQTLMERHQFGSKNIKYDLLMNKAERFSVDISNLLLALHHNNKEQQCFILTTLKPNYLISKQQDCFMLTNFSNLINTPSSTKMLPFTKQEGEGINYYSPQMLRGKICAKSNIWSFGCVLFQILANGQRLIQSQQYYNKANNQDLANYIKRRISICQYRLDRLQELKNQETKNYWLKVVQKCVEVNVDHRFGAHELHKTIAYDNKENEWARLSPNELGSTQSRIFYELSFQYFRANQLQDKIFALFDQLYKMEATTTKYIYYIAIKFIAVFFLENYQINKQKAELCSKPKTQDYYSQFLSINQWKKIKDIKDNITEKILKWMHLEERQYQNQVSKQPISANTKKIQQLQIQNKEGDNMNSLFDKKRLKQLREDITVSFPEHKDRKISDTHNLLYAFCYKYRDFIKQSQTIYNILAEALLYTRSLVDHAQLVCKEIELKQYIEVVALRYMYPFFNKCQSQAQNQSEKIVEALFKVGVTINRISAGRMAQIK